MLRHDLTKRALELIRARVRPNLAGHVNEAPRLRFVIALGCSFALHD